MQSVFGQRIDKRPQSTDRALVLFQPSQAHYQRALPGPEVWRVHRQCLRAVNRDGSTAAAQTSQKSALGIQSFVEASPRVPALRERLGAARQGCETKGDGQARERHQEAGYRACGWQNSAGSTTIEYSSLRHELHSDLVDRRRVKSGIAFERQIINREGLKIKSFAIH